MATTRTRNKTKTQERPAEFAIARPVLSDMNAVVETALNVALDRCARKAGLRDNQAVAEQLRQGNPLTENYFLYDLAGLIAESMANLDAGIRAVYRCEYDATPEDLCFAEGRQPAQIHLIVWAERKTSALEALLAAFGAALAPAYAEMTGAPKPEHLLDAQIVDDAEVSNCRGYGAMLQSINNPPLCVWKR